MSKKVPFSRKNMILSEIASYHIDSENSFRQFFVANNVRYPQRFTGYTLDDLALELEARLSELNHGSSLSILASLEAQFRIDYLQRNYKKKKDPLSRSFRELYAQKENKASFESDILEAWKNNANGVSDLIGELKGVYKYRHWLAHGRYWVPKLGRRNYDYASVYELAELVLNSFPFEGVNA